MTDTLPNNAFDHRNLGKLHALLSKGLPDYWNESGVLDVRRLANDIAVSFQAVYSWFARESIGAKRVEQIVSLSKKTKNKPHFVTNADGDKEPWQPLCRDDFWEFIGR